MHVRALRLAGAALIAAVLAPAIADAQYYVPPPPPPPGYYDRRGYDYPPPPPGYYRYPPRRYYGRRYYRRCDRGTGGTIIGAIAGGLLGNAAAGRGNRGAGTVIGAGAGALAGRAIDRDC